MSVISISFVFSSGLWLEKKETNYNTGEIVPTPVPIEIVKRAVMNDNGLKLDSEDPICNSMWGPYVDCEIYPMYDENNIPIEYLVLAYRERSERIGMWEMLEKIKPYIYELMKLDGERARIEREETDFNYDNRYYEIVKNIEEISKKINGNFQYGNGFASGVYELPPRISMFLNGCIPFLFTYYYKALDEVKEKYNTDDVEFVCFRSLGISGSRGWEFRAGNKQLYVTVYLEGIGGEERGKISIKEITPELKSFWIDRYKKEYRELWKNYETDDMQGMLNRINDEMWLYMLPNVADFGKYPKLPWGSCAHVAASNILAYQNYMGYNVELEKWAWIWIRGQINWEYRSQWITYAKDNPNYKNDNVYGWQFQASTYIISGRMANPNDTSYVEQMIVIFTQDCGFTGYKSWNIYFLSHSDLNWYDIVDELRYHNPSWIGVNRDEYKDEEKNPTGGHAVSVIGSQDGYPRYLYVKDNWYSINEYHYGEYCHRIPWWTDEYGCQPYSVCIIEPYGNAVWFLDYFVGYPGLYSVELAWGAMTDGYSAWNIYRAEHPTGPFTTYTGVKVNDNPIEQQGPWYQEFRYNDSSMIYSDHYYYMIEDAQYGDVYWYQSKPGWNYPPPPWIPFGLPLPPSRPPAPWALLATDRPMDDGYAIELRWDRYYFDQSGRYEPMEPEPMDDYDQQIILRGEEPHGDFKLIATVPDTVVYYLDDTVPCNGKTYYYVVRTEKFNPVYRDSEDSNIAEGVAIDNSQGGLLASGNKMINNSMKNPNASNINVYNTSLTDSSSFNIPSSSPEKIIKDIRIYPMPASDYLKYDIELNEPHNVKISLYDISGRKLIDKEYSSYNGDINDNIDINTLSAGIYLFNVYIDNKCELSRKVIVVK